MLPVVEHLRGLGGRDALCQPVLARDGTAHCGGRFYDLFRFQHNANANIDINININPNCNYDCHREQ